MGMNLVAHKAALRQALILAVTAEKGRDSRRAVDLAVQIAEGLDEESFNDVLSKLEKDFTP